MVKFTKRLYSLLLVSVLMLSTAACSSGNDAGEAVSQEKEVAKERNNVTFEDISQDIRGNKIQHRSRQTKSIKR